MGKHLSVSDDMTILLTKPVKVSVDIAANGEDEHSLSSLNGFFGDIDIIVENTQIPIPKKKDSFDVRREHNNGYELIRVIELGVLLAI